jgi:hypothetical protein
MASLNDVFNKLKKSIIGSSLDDLLNVTKSLKKLSGVSASAEISTFSDLMKSLSKDKKVPLDSLLNEMGLEAPTIQDAERISRYTEYISIVNKIPYLKKAIRIITQNILSPDNFTKTSLLINIDTKDVDVISQSKSEVERIIKGIEIEKHLFDIVYNTLMTGDYFVEIVVVDEILRTYQLLESSNKKKLVETYSFNYELEDKKSKLTLELDMSLKGMTYKLLESSNNKNKKVIPTNGIFLNYLNPAQVVRIGDKQCFGYFVFPTIGDYTQMMSIPSSLDYYEQSSQQIVDKVIDKLIAKISSDKVNLLKTRKDLRPIVARLLLDNNIAPEKQTVRFVPAELMQSFKVFENEFAPYGTSILKGSEFLSKMIIAMQSSLMVQRIMSAQEKRIIKIDIGVTRDAKKYLNEFKTKLRRKQYTVDNIGTIDEIPTNISTFEDIYVPVQNGRELINIDTIPPRGDIGQRVEDIKLLRDSLVATVDVPAPYLGIEENVESRATLSQENMVFVSSIINYQSSFSNDFTELIRKVLKLTSKTAPETVSVTLPLPRSILAQTQSDYYNNVINMINQLIPLGIPVEFLIKKYLPDIDMDEVRKFLIDQKLDVTQSKPKEENTGM